MGRWKKDTSKQMISLNPAYRYPPIAQGGVKLDVEIRLKLVDIVQMPQPQRDAFMLGIAEVVSAMGEPHPA